MLIWGTSCGFVDIRHYLRRGQVCRLSLLLALASAVTLGSESRGTHDHILLTQIQDSPQPGGPGHRIYIPQEQGCPVIPPGTGFTFRRLLRLTRLWSRYSNPPPYGYSVSVYSLWADPTKNTASNRSYIVARAYPLPRRCVYRVIAQQQPSLLVLLFRFWALSHYIIWVSQCR
jgi:hypothetical protein